VRSHNCRTAFAAANDGDGVTLGVANRLFGQKDYAFRPEFLALVGEEYGAPLQLADFAGDAKAETRIINAWVEEQTRDRIRNLLPEERPQRPDAPGAGQRGVYEGLVAGGVSGGASRSRPRSASGRATRTCRP
jgi:serine protease inhibitor